MTGLHIALLHHLTVEYKLIIYRAKYIHDQASWSSFVLLAVGPPCFHIVEKHSALHGKDTIFIHYIQLGIEYLLVKMLLELAVTTNPSDMEKIAYSGCRIRHSF